MAGDSFFSTVHRPADWFAPAFASVFCLHAAWLLLSFLFGCCLSFDCRYSVVNSLLDGVCLVSASLMLGLLDPGSQGRLWELESFTTLYTLNRFPLTFRRLQLNQGKQRAYYSTPGAFDVVNACLF